MFWQTCNLQIKVSFRNRWKLLQTKAILRFFIMIYRRENWTSPTILLSTFYIYQDFPIDSLYLSSLQLCALPLPLSHPLSFPFPTLHCLKRRYWLEDTNQSTDKELGGILKSSLCLQSIGLAKNFIQVFLQDVLEKLEGNFWPVLPSPGTWNLFILPHLIYTVNHIFISGCTQIFYT